ncbi:MAG: efflux RND transporter permease subunit, partial [Pirellulaceae bacterium]
GGMPLNEALVDAGRRRFRPVMLTSITTVAGLFPMLMETSMQAQVLIPMAASLVFGLMTGTLLILILVPVFYSIYGRIAGVEKLRETDDYQELLKANLESGGRE